MLRGAPIRFHGTYASINLADRGQSDATAFLYYTLMFRMFVATYVMSSLSGWSAVVTPALASAVSIAWHALTSVTHNPDRGAPSTLAAKRQGADFVDLVAF